jgi:CheY-like chemotaxis protein
MRQAKAMSEPAANPLLLYVEDEENDRVLVQYALKRSVPHVTLITAPDGVEAIRWLSGRAGTNRHLSCVLLDLNLPRKNGFEVLAWIRQQPEYKDLRVVVLTSSDLTKDRERVMELGADGYHVKTGELKNYGDLLRTLFPG